MFEVWGETIEDAIDWVVLEFDDLEEASAA